MPSLVRCTALVVAVSSMAFASSARAQLKVELGATIGEYAPLGNFQPAQVYSTSLPRSPSDLSGAAFGGELRVWFAPRVGVALTGSTASSTVGGAITPEGQSPYIPVRVSTGSAQLLYLVTGDNSRARVWVGTGLSLVQHGGKAYEPYGSPVSLGSALGIGSAIRIRGGLSAEVGVSSLIYELNVRGSNSTIPPVSETGTQVDLQLRTGLSYALH